MSVDRALLRAPIDGLRAQLAESGIDIPPTPVQVADQVRASWRFDLTALGLDTTDIGHLAGALAGLVIAGKLQGLPVPFYVTTVRMFDVLEPLLDNPTPWLPDQPEGVEAPETTVSTPWGPVPGRDLTQVAEALARGNDLPRFNLSDPADLARLASGDTGHPRPGVQAVAFGSEQELVEWAKAQPWFPKPDEPPPVARPVSKAKRMWVAFRDAYRAEMARRSNR